MGGQGALRVNRFNPYEGWVGCESVGADILVSGRAAMNRALDGDIVAVELLPEDQCARASKESGLGYGITLMPNPLNRHEPRAGRRHRGGGAAARGPVRARL